MEIKNIHICYIDKILSCKFWTNKITLYIYLKKLKIIFKQKNGRMEGW